MKNHRLVDVATRRQGLIVAKGNPRKLSDVEDLARPGVRFVNRQRESGTPQTRLRRVRASG